MLAAPPAQTPIELPAAAPAAAPVPTALAVPAPTPAAAPAPVPAPLRLRLGSRCGSGEGAGRRHRAGPGADRADRAGGALPRRTPKRPLDEPVHSQAGPEPVPADTARPADTSTGGLRRRVRGATLEGRPGAVPPTAAPREVDAEAVRDSMEEFEEAVRRAELDSIQNDVRTPERPEGTGS
ncbi:hypothetical protein GXW82_34775 [Streptacidiphilus sp. 4-A2]|nr:hypothetical protein [Streptacidiphilus sp. 4-A2]